VSLDALKTDCRRQAKESLRSMSLIQKHQANAIIVSHLKSFFSTRNSDEIWGAYLATPDEPDLTELFKASSHIRWAFPCVKLGNAMEFVEATSATLKDILSWPTNQYGIREPNYEIDRCVDGKITGFLVPGLAFDRDGNRLGRGAGHYDRYFQNQKILKPSAPELLRIGVHFYAQLTAKVMAPIMEKHDEIMTGIVNETFFMDLNCNQKN
jgi:5-formyltetrahydrofolate cyclo-ligase